MSDMHLDLPPMPHGTEQEQILQLYRYLFKLAEVLRVMLDGE